MLRLGAYSEAAAKDFLDSPRGRARARGVIFFTRPGPGSGAREGMVIAPQSVLALWFSS